MASKEKNFSITLSQRRMPENVFNAINTADSKAQLIIDAVTFYLEHKDIPDNLLKNKLDTMQQGISMILKQMDSMSSSEIIGRRHIEPKLHIGALKVVENDLEEVDVSKNEISTEETQAVVKTSVSQEEINIKEVLNENYNEEDTEVSEEALNMASLFGIEIDED